MSEFDDLEASVEASAPREGIEIRHGLVIHRVATGSRDVVLNGNRFKAGTASRGQLTIDPSARSDGMEIQLPTSHAFVQRYIASPTDSPTVTVYRRQGDETRRIWTGVVTGVAVDPERHLAKFSCMSFASEALNRRMPTVTVSALCPHVLYDGNCKVARTVPFRQVSTVTLYGGKFVRVASIGAFADDYAKFGELVHVASGERAPIVSQIGANITLQRPIYELRDGDQVHIYAGCAHDIATCRDKFSNVVNFGGAPQLPSANMYIPGSLGIYTTEPEE